MRAGKIAQWVGLLTAQGQPGLFPWRLHGVLTPECRAWSKLSSEQHQLWPPSKTKQKYGGGNKEDGAGVLGWSP